MIAALIGLAVAVVALVAAIVYFRAQIENERNARVADAERHRDELTVLEQQRARAELESKEEALRIRTEMEAELRERRAEVARLEARSVQREETLDRRRAEMDQRDERLNRREADVAEREGGLEAERAAITTELGRVAALTQQEARAELLASVEGELTGEIAQR